MISMSVEGVRRNFTISSVFQYSVSLLDETGQRLLVFGVERHEAVAICAALNDVSLPRPQTIHTMIETLALLHWTLDEVRIEHFSMLPSAYNLCSCTVHWRNGEAVQEQALQVSPGDIVGLALSVRVPLLVSDEVFKQWGTQLSEGQTPELLFARLVLRQEGISLPLGKELRLGYGKTPLRDAFVKECKAALLGKAPPFPEEDMAQRKKEYLAFLLR